MPRIPSPPTHTKAQQHKGGAQPPLGALQAQGELVPTPPRAHRNTKEQRDSIESRKGPQAPRLRPQLRQALHLLATTGRRQRDIAEEVGIHEKSLSRALSKPHVAAYLENLKALDLLESKALREQAKAMAIRKGMELMETAKSEVVQARMVEFFAAEPKAGTSINVNVPVHTGGYAYPDRLISGRATDGASVDGQAQPIEDAEVVEPGCEDGPSQPPTEGA